MWRPPWLRLRLPAGRPARYRSGLLILVGVRAGCAVLATLACRIAAYWLPLLAGPPAYLLVRHRYGRPVLRRATPDEDDFTA